MHIVKWYLPESWLSGTVISIYKNKGDIKQPEDNRLITSLSCLGKLFTCIVNQRLTDFIESNNLLNIINVVSDAIILMLIRPLYFISFLNIVKLDEQRYTVRL